MNSVVPRHCATAVRLSGNNDWVLSTYAIALAKAGRKREAAAEVGDLLFAVVNLARHLDGDPEGVLRATNQKFQRRFASIERALAARGKTPAQADLAEMDALWDAAKEAEKSGS